MSWELIVGAIVAGVVGVSILQYRAASGQYRPLSQRQPKRRVVEKPELGMEAINMDEVHRTQRRNESFERANTNWTRRRDATSAADTDIQPLADDETYSARFHAAFNSKKNKDRSQ